MSVLRLRCGPACNTGPLPQQVANAWHRVVRLSLPDGWLAETGRHDLRSQLAKPTRVHSGVATS